MTARWVDHFGTGIHSARPAASAVPKGAMYACSTHGLIYQSDGSSTWSTWATLGATGGSVATDAIFDAKGDLAVGTGADTAAKLGVGSNGQVLTADSTQTTGVKWGTPSAGGGAVLSARFNGPNSGTDITTSSTSFVDLTGYTVSIAAAVGDVLEITLMGTYFGSTASDRAQFQLLYNGAAAGPVFQQAIPGVAAMVTAIPGFQHVVVSGDITGGNVPVKVQWKRLTTGGAGPLNWLDSGGVFGQLNVKNLLH